MSSVSVRSYYRVVTGQQSVGVLFLPVAAVISAASWELITTCGTLLALLAARRAAADDNTVGAMKRFTQPRERRGPASIPLLCVCKCLCLQLIATLPPFYPVVISISSSHSTYPKCPVPYACFTLQPSILCSDSDVDTLQSV